MKKEKQECTGKSKGLKNLKPWKKGQSGNPAGHPLGVPQWRTVIREQFESGKIKRSDIAQVVIDKANKGDIRAIELIMDREEGKPNQPISGVGLTIVDLIQRGENARQQAKAEATDKK